MFRCAIVPRFGLGGVLAATMACKGPPAEPVLDAAPSPQAKAEPAPLANPPSAAATAAPTPAWADGGGALGPLRSDRPLAPDFPREAALRETGGKDTARDLAGYALQAIVRTGEGPPAPRTPEVNATVVETARRRTETRLAVEMSQTRARFVLSGAFVLPPGAELRSRWDAYGHILLWPGEDSYRVVPPGALRALLGERRLDVAPVSRATVGAPVEGPRKLGLPTRRVDIATRAAKATLELATLRDAGEGGPLVCRFLLDLVSAPASTAVCASDEVPLHAELRWTTRGALTFDVASIARRTDFAPQELAVPPAAAAFTTAPPPAAPSDVLVPRAELASLRTGPADIPPLPPADAQAPPPESGLVLVNSSDELRVAWIDGFAAAWVGPGGRASLPSLLRGRYAVQWRTFLGDGWEPPQVVFAPGVTDAAEARSAGP